MPGRHTLSLLCSLGLTMGSVFLSHYPASVMTKSVSLRPLDKVLQGLVQLHLEFC